MSSGPRVYAVYDSHHVLLHDERHMHVIYEAIDLTAIDEASTSESRRRQARRQKIRDTTAKYRAILTNLASGRESEKYAKDQARVARMFESVPGKDGSGKDGSRYSGSIGRMRTQNLSQGPLCRRYRALGPLPGPDRGDLRGLRPAGRALAATLRGIAVPDPRSFIGVRRGYLAIRARHGAQLPEDGARYDERYDPIAASDAAARHLQDNYELLRTWPLAVTAYNHGANGMRRAVRLLGTRDLGTISERYRSRTFGFASRNFYSEFIAAVRSMRIATSTSPASSPLPPWSSRPSWPRGTYRSASSPARLRRRSTS